MKNSVKISIGILVFFAAVWACTPRQATTNVILKRGELPQNVLVSCTVSQDTFNTWFAGGKASTNGFVLPANSVGFPSNNTNCTFYQWSEQMFLWITSTETKGPDAGKSVLESSTFYNVSPETPETTRYLTPHDPRKPLQMAAEINQEGPDKLPVIFDKKGREFEVEETPPGAKPIVLDAKGNKVEVASAKPDTKGFLLLTDKTGKPIVQPKAAIPAGLISKNVVQEIKQGGKSFYFDVNGEPVQSEAGQATGDVLMAQNGSLVYYLIMVNDFYAAFLDAVKDNYMPGTTFPTTPADRDLVCKYARMHPLLFPNKLLDSNALAIELKSSWVEASTLKDSADYFMVDAVIPVYHKVSDTLWAPYKDSTRKARMAMVGIHVVGSAAGHPEMIWATFEHKAITPSAAYTYVDLSNNVDTVKQDTGGGWLFSANASDAGPNVSHMSIVDNKSIATETIKADSGFTISPSNTLIVNAWGTVTGTVPNQEDKSSAASNSEIISLNNTIDKLFGGAGVRNKYMLIGATWTMGGAPPIGKPYGTNTSPGVAIGTNVLANSTMETYFQYSTTTCFTCHNSGKPYTVNPKSELSHIFDGLYNGLPAAAAAKAAKK